MINRLPVGIDPVFEFVVKRNDGQWFDLTTVTRYVCVVSKATTSGEVLASLDSTIDSSRFNIDTAGHIVKVQLFTDEATPESGSYWVNLWVYTGVIKTTHLSVVYEVENAPQPQPTSGHSGS